MPASVHPPADLPLRTRTSSAWAVAALADPLALLDDHAHLERKAAANALALLPRWPGGAAGDPEAGAAWARRLAGIAQDEVEHLGLVLRLLGARGGRLSRLHANPYAAALRAEVRAGAGREELLDRLLVAALIEARSCERFEALAAQAADPELRRLYRGLRAAERGHGRAFLVLAGRAAGSAEVRDRLDVLLEVEARVLAVQAPGPRMHSGEP